MKIIIRILGIPFILGLSILSAIKFIVLFNYNYIKYGGEFMTYARVNQKTVELLISKLIDDYDEI